VIEPDAVKSAYRDETYERLVALKNEYDPMNFFCTNPNISRQCFRRKSIARSVRTYSRVPVIAGLSEEALSESCYPDSTSSALVKQN
jgi:hypothetical protein